MKRFLSIFILVHSLHAVDAQFNNSKILNGGTVCSYAFDSSNNIIYAAQLGPQLCLIKSDSMHQQILWKYALPDSSFVPLLSIRNNDIYLIVQHASLSNPTYVTLMRIDPGGNLLWSKKIFSNLFANLNVTANCLFVSSEKKIFIGSGICSFFNLILCLDSTGNPIWQKTFNAIQATGHITSINESSDGNLIVTSNSVELPMNYRVLIIFKMDTSGNVLWNQFYEVPFFCTAFDTKGILDFNQDMFFNITIADSFNVRYSVMLKTDNLGNLLWSKNYTPIQTSYAYTYIKDFDYDNSGNLFVLNNFSGNGSDTLISTLIRVDPQNGNIKNVLSDSSVYHINNPNFESFDFIKYQNPNKIILFGESFNDALVISCDTLGAGACNFHSTYFTPQAFSFVPQPYSLITNSNGISIIDTLIIWSKEAAIIIPYCNPIGISESIPENNFSIFPNPAIDKLTVIGCYGGEKINIHNTIGKIVFENLITDSKAEINVTGLSPGIYFITIYREKQHLLWQKFVKI
jgi:hypothetical protein